MIRAEGDLVNSDTPGRNLHILIPVYNEEKSILLVLHQLNKMRMTLPHAKIIVIDDGSLDKTPLILENNRNLFDLLISSKINMGKGWAIREGLKVVTDGYVVIQDADLEYIPEDIPKLWRLVLTHSAGVVASSRFSGSQVTRVHYFWHKFGNHLITFFFNLTHNTTFTDIYSGYLLFDSSLINPYRLRFKKWGQQAEILSMLVQSKRSIYEIPINYYGRTYAEGKKIRAFSVFSVFLAIFITRIRFIFR